MQGTLIRTRCEIPMDGAMAQEIRALYERIRMPGADGPWENAALAEFIGLGQSTACALAYEEGLLSLVARGTAGELAWCSRFLQALVKHYAPDKVIALNSTWGSLDDDTDAYGSAVTIVTATSIETIGLPELAAQLRGGAAEKVHDTGEPRDARRHRCLQCGGGDVEVCLPGWFDADDLSFRSCDAEAEANAWYCPACEDTVAVITPDGRRSTSRWGCSGHPLCG
jgi:hypothetical protein